LVENSDTDAKLTFEALAQGKSKITCGEERDNVESYDLKANACVVKPVDLDKCFKAVRAIQKF